MLTIIRKKIADLHADPANANRHPEKNLRLIADSLHAFGQVEPLIVQKGTGKVIGGNGRLEVLRNSGAQEVDVVELDIDGTQATALAIALNRTAKTSEFDDETLASLLQSLPTESQVAAGFDDNDLKELLSSLTPEVVEDVVPEPPTTPVSRSGDLWLCGVHRVLCGDSTKAEDVNNVMNGKKADLCLTDPPYGCGEAYQSHNDTQENLGSLAERFFPLARSVSKVVAMTPGIQNVRHYPHSDWMLCWFYGVGTGRTPWGFTCWQPVLVWGKDPKLAEGEGCHPDGVNKLMSSEDMEINRNLKHACPKPVSVWSWFLDRLTTEIGEIVFEPFCGSGTTIVCCEQLKRICFAIEIDPIYVDVTINRWQTLTGKHATLEATGKTFNETKEDRVV